MGRSFGHVTHVKITDAGEYAFHNIGYDSFFLANTNYRNYANLIESKQTICDTSAHLFCVRTRVKMKMKMKMKMMVVMMMLLLIMMMVLMVMMNDDE